MKKTDFNFMTPAEVVNEFQPVSAIKVPNPISWADEERDLTAWLGNDLQDAAFNKLYSLTGRVENCEDAGIRKDWDFLQVSDHFYYMCTKFFSDGAVHQYFNPYESPYDAFMNYMNVLSDFEIRLDSICPEHSDNQELISLRNKIEQIEEELNEREQEVRSLRAKMKSMTVSTTKTDTAGRSAKTESKGKVRQTKTTKTGKTTKKTNTKKK
jgi:alpha-amylase